MSSNPLVNDIAKGTNLKHTETVDKSAPVISGDVHIQKNNHSSLLSEVEKGAKLNKVDDVNDRSAPKIEDDTKIGKNNHNALLGEIKAKSADN